MNKRVYDAGFEFTKEKDQGTFHLEIPRESLFTTIQCEMCIFLFLTGERGKGTKQDELLQIFINKVNIYVLWEREPSAIYQSYIHLRKNLLSWNKLGIYPIFLLPVLGPSPTKEDVWGYGVAINMVSK